LIGNLCCSPLGATEKLGIWKLFELCLVAWVRLERWCIQTSSADDTTPYALITVSNCVDNECARPYMAWFTIKALRSMRICVHFLKAWTKHGWCNPTAPKQRVIPIGSHPVSRDVASPGVPQATGPRLLDANMHACACITARIVTNLLPYTDASHRPAAPLRTYEYYNSYTN
jgi:hypothetical protein